MRRQHQTGPNAVPNFRGIPLDVHHRHTDSVGDCFRNRHRYRDRDGDWNGNRHRHGYRRRDGDAEHNDGGHRRFRVHSFHRFDIRSRGLDLRIGERGNASLHDRCLDTGGHGQRQRQ
jgi:hypothetical protein